MKKKTQSSYEMVLNVQIFKRYSIFFSSYTNILYYQPYFIDILKQNRYKIAIKIVQKIPYFEKKNSFYMQKDVYIKWIIYINIHNLKQYKCSDMIKQVRINVLQLLISYKNANSINYKHKFHSTTI